MAPISLGIGTCISTFRPVGGGGGGDPASDYIARYTMDDASGADETGNYDGTWTNAPDVITGVLGNAVQLNTPSDNDEHLTAASVPSAATTAKTYTVWFKCESPTNDYLFDHYPGVRVPLDATNILIGMINTGQNVVFLYTGARATLGITTGWHHLAIVTDGDGSSSGSFLIYIDGTDRTSDFTKSGSGPDATGTTSTLRIGGRSSTTDRDYAGDIDDFRIYNRALSSTEVTALYDWYLDQQDITTSLTHYWRPSTELDADDTVGSKNGTDNGTVSYSSEGADFGTNAANYTTFGTFSPSSTDYSISIWANLTELHAQFGSIIWGHRVDNVNANSNFLLYLDTSDLWSIYQYCGSSLYSATWATAATTGAWVNLAATINSTGSELKLYANGSLVDTTAMPATANTVSAPMSIGQDPWLPGVGLNYRGKYDDARMYYGRVLTDAEIITLYSLGRGA
jgi:hypothetical protein